jgi:anti-sigma regulatory factor (Ser/Thr protein kinase)
VSQAHDRFHHEALFYTAEAEYVAGTVPFIRAGLAADEPILVAVGEDKARLLRSALGGEAGRVRFIDMVRLGRNPACIIPAWRAFVADHTGGGRRVRGIGEPVWPGRTADELVECDSHESLLNLAFDDGPPWSLLCPYDVAALDAHVVATARRNHPVVSEDGISRRSHAYVPPALAQSPFEGPLPQSPAEVHELRFSDHEFRSVRRFIAAHARRAGLGATRTEDLVLAVNELATNTLRHGGGRGLVRVWREDGALVCEVRDAGRITQPLAGRVRPPDTQPGGRGLWMVNHLCDLVQIRSRPGGNVIRLRMCLGTS